MSSNQPVTPLGRRHFIRQACCAAVGSTGLISTLAQLRLIGAVAGDRVTAAALPADYKALVCVFLGGGNDGSNLIIPSDASSHAAYAQTRSILAVNRTALLPIVPRQYSDGRTYGLNPAVPDLQRLFTSGRVALLANVGTLVQPTTLAQYRNGGALPSQLFAHNEQATQWQSSVPDRPFQTGWGGRLADLVNAFNANNQISMSISLDGQSSFQVGQSVTGMTIFPNGVSTLYTNEPTMAQGTPAVLASAARDLMNPVPPNLLGAAFAGITKSSLADNELVGSLLNSAAPLATVFPGSGIASQLKMAARLMSIAPALGLKRQVFFCQLRGFDTHAAQVSSHGPLLAELSTALAAFYDVTVELGIANQVTTFTASDFGRTFTANADGSDHGWGNHHLIMGGAVQGGDIYGSMPSLAIGGPDDPGQGRWIPSTSVDEYAATLATWFGVSATNLPLVLPNIGRFTKPNLGFL